MFAKMCSSRNQQNAMICNTFGHPMPPNCKNTQGFSILVGVRASHFGPGPLMNISRKCATALT